MVMDTFSTSIATAFTIPKSNLINHHHHQHHLLSSSSTKQKPSKLISNKTTTTTSASASASASARASRIQSHPLHPHVKHYSPRPHGHHRASTGYAVALLDAARRHNAVEAVHRDVKRLSRWLGDEHLRGAMADPLIAKEVVRDGRFEKHVAKLVKLLAEKSKVDLLRQVLSEFGKIYEQLSLSLNLSPRNEQLLLLPSGFKVEDNQILEIVGRIQSLTAADKVTVLHHR